MAIYYFRNTGDVNWGTATNWSLTDGGGATGAVPTAADDAYFTSNSGNCTVNTSARVCKTLIFSGVGAGNYANTLTMTNAITASGSVTLSATMTIAGTAALTINATGTLTSNTKTWPNSLTLAGTSQTYTLADNWTVTGSLTLSGTTAVNLTGAFNMNVGGSLTVAVTSTGTVSATIILNGTGTWSGSTALRNNLTINTAGTITINSNIGFNTGTLTYTAGTVNVTAGTLNILASTTTTLATNGILWNNVQFSGTSTIATLTNDLTCVLLFLGSTSTVNGSTIYTNGLQVNGSITGTTNIEINGTGTWTGIGGYFTNNLNINCTALTITGPAGYRTGTLTYTAGAVTTTGSTLTIGASTTLNTNGINWDNISISGTITLTLNSLLTALGTLTLPNANFTLAGTAGFTAGTLTTTALTTLARTYTFVATKTYTITNSLTFLGASTSANLIMVSSIPGSQYNFILNQGATQDVGHVSATDANSSAGQTIWDWKPTLSNTLNWNSLTAPQTVFSTFST